MPKRSKHAPEGATPFEHQLAHQMGRRLRERREALGITQSNLLSQLQATGVYMSRAQYSRVELGESLLNVAEVIALAQALAVSERWLLRGEPQPCDPDPPPKPTEHDAQENSL